MTEEQAQTTDLAVATQEHAATMALPSEHELGRMERIAGALANSEIVPKAYRRKPHDILAAALAGRELGLSPMSALQRIFVVDGRPTLSAEGMAALVAKAGHEIWIDEKSDDKKAVVYGRRRNSDQVHTMSFTIEEAKTAGLAGKDNWKKYPKAMLRARAISALSRIAFADVLAGYVYTADEMGAVVSEDGTVIEATVVDSKPADATAGDELPEWVTEAAERFGDAAVIEAAERIRQELNVGAPITGIKGLAKAKGDIKRRIAELLERDYTPVQPEDVSARPDEASEVEDAEVVADHPCPMCGAECAPIDGPARSPKWGCTNWSDCPGDDNNTPWKSWHNDPWKSGGQIEQRQAAVAGSGSGDSAPPSPEGDAEVVSPPPKVGRGGVKESSAATDNAGTGASPSSSDAPGQQALVD